MSGNETYCRFIYHPNFLDENKKKFDYENFINFQPISNNDNKIRKLFVTSIFSKSALGSEEKIHAQGIKVGESKNKRKMTNFREAGKSFQKEHKIEYLGYYQLNIQRLESINVKMECSQVSITHYSRNSSSAHYHIELKVLNSESKIVSKTKVAFEKAKATELIVEILEGPFCTNERGVPEIEKLICLLPILPKTP